MGQKLGGGGCALVPFSSGRTGSPSNTKSPGPRPTSIPSGILVHPAIWPQWTLAENWGAPLGKGELGFHLTQCRIGRGLPPYQVASCAKTFVRTVYGNSSCFEVKAGMHQRSAVSPLFSVTVMEAISRQFRVALPWELLYADDLAVIAETVYKI